MKQIFSCCLLVVFLLSCNKKQEYHLDIQYANSLVATPVALNIPDFANESLFTLYNEKEKIPYQIDSANNKIWFVHQPARSINYFIEKRQGNRVPDNIMKLRKKEGSLQLLLADNPVIQYRYEMHYPPTGVDSIFRKSGYLHPVLTPKGDTLSRINPPDHNHHYGIWGPWTHTQIDTTRVDFWNLVEAQGTVLFKEFKSTTTGSVFNGFNAIQEHIDLKTKKAPQIALNESLEVRVWDLGRPDRYMFDYSSSFSSPLKNGILFEAYRYGGGIGMRFNEHWKKDNCQVLTSEGKTRLDADGSNARWAIVSSQDSKGEGVNGILFMSYPENRMHPEPMRVWPIDANEGRGDMFFEFCPIRHQEWKIDPNQTYSLKYRMVVFDGKLTAKEAEAYWQAFAKP